jgi:hypothetical protein
MLGLVGTSSKQIDRSKHHAWGTEAALQTMVPAKCFLDRMHLVALRKPFDGRDLMATRLHRKHQAGTNRIPIKKDRACPANTMFASNVDTGHSHRVAQKVRKQRAELGDAAQRFAIHCYI